MRRMAAPPMLKFCLLYTSLVEVNTSQPLWPVLLGLDLCMWAHTAKRIDFILRHRRPKWVRNWLRLNLISCQRANCLRSDLGQGRLGFIRMAAVEATDTLARPADFLRAGNGIISNIHIDVYKRQVHRLLSWSAHTSSSRNASLAKWSIKSSSFCLSINYPPRRKFSL